MFFIAIFDKFKREVLELVTSLRFHKDLSLVGMTSTGKWTATCFVIPEFRLNFPQPCSQLDSSMQDDATLGLQELGERCRRCDSFWEFLADWLTRQADRFMKGMY